MKFKIQIGNLFVMASIAFLGPFVFAGDDSCVAIDLRSDALGEDRTN